MRKKLVKNIILITAGLLICSMTVTGCSMLVPKKRYSLELEVKCPNGETVNRLIPEVMMAGV